MLNLDYPHILKHISDYKLDKRTESAAFLIWYLLNYYRLDHLEAVDSVCDQRGDKGIDGIYLNEGENTIDIFQAKIIQNAQSTIGDSTLKEFYGSLSQFDSRKKLQNLIDTSGDTQVVNLIKRLDLSSKLDAFAIRGLFIANIELDSNGEAFLNTNPHIEFIGKNKLQNTYISDSRQVPLDLKASFDILGFEISKYIVDQNTLAIVAPIKANQLVTLQGISDQSIFAYNVRGALGKTQVNKDIAKSVKDASLHKKFPLFHNGITIVADKIVTTNEKIEVETYFVVNGCQSLTTLYENRKYITDDLRLLTRFIQVNVDSALAGIITKNSNTQNGVKPRDFKSNNPTQIRLQNEFYNIYHNQYFYEIKRGESPNGSQIISNESAGIYLMSFDLKEPWNTHRKYQVFEEKFDDLFSRPEVDADRIVMLDILDEIIEKHMPQIINQLFGRYILTRYMILYILRLIFESDETGKKLIKNPKEFIRELSDREYFKVCISKLISDITVDINAEINELGDDFDYRAKLRDEQWVKSLSKSIVSNYLKLVSRGRIDSFQIEWKNRKNENKSI